MDQQKIGEFIAKLRKEKGMTQQELAKKIGVTDKAISKWENGICLMDISMLKPLSKSLGITEMELINGERIENNINNDKSSEFVEVTIKLANKKIKDSVKKIIIGIIVVLLLIGLISGILYIKKFAYDYVYNYDNCEYFPVFSEKFKFEDEMVVNNVKLSEDEYLLLNNFYFHDDFLVAEVFRPAEIKIKKELFEGIEYETGYWRSSSDGDGKGFRFTLEQDWLYNFVYDSSGSAIIVDTFKYRSEFLMENNIMNEIDLLKYIGNNYNRHDNNWLTNSLSEMKNDFIIKQFLSNMGEYELEKLSIISGDYNGYIMKKEDEYDIRILLNDVVFHIELYDYNKSKYISDEFVQEFLNTLEVDYDGFDD